MCIYIYTRVKGFLWSIWTNLQVQFTRAQHSSYSIRIMYDTCVLPVCVCKLHRTKMGCFCFHGPFFCLSLSLSLSVSLSFVYLFLFLLVSLSLSLSFCLSSTICLSVCLFLRREREKFSFLSSLSFCFAKRRNRWWNDGGIVNNHRLQNHVHPCFLIPFLSPRFEKFRLSKHTPVVVVTERCVPYYLRNSTVLLLLLSEVHVVLKRISFHSLLGSKPFSVKVNVNVVTELRWRIRKKKKRKDYSSG